MKDDLKVSAQAWHCSLIDGEVICYSRIHLFIPEKLLRGWDIQTFTWWSFANERRYLGRRRKKQLYDDTDLWWIPGDDFLHLGLMEYEEPTIERYD